jgi:uncharacterized membrane protein
MIDLIGILFYFFVRKEYTCCSSHFIHNLRRKMEYIYTYLWSITPVVELRGAIPIGYLHYDLPILTATLIGFLGGITIVLFCLLILPILFKALDYVPTLKTLKEAVLEKTRARHSEKMLLWGEFFLVVLVAIPLPGSGAFTGSIVAYLFGIPARAAFLLISGGTIISGLIVAALTFSGKGLWGLIAGIF